LSKRAKGNRTQRKVIEYFQDQGWIVDTVEKKGKFVKFKDLFGDALEKEYRDRGFDIIGVKPNCTMYCQIKTNTPSTQSFYKQFAKRFAGDNVLVCVATWYDHKGLRLQWYNNKGRIKEVDLRK
jgi:hypothetical protein